MASCLDDSTERTLFYYFYLQTCSLGLLFGKGNTLTVFVAVAFMFVAVAFMFVAVALMFVSMAFVAMLMALVTMAVFVGMCLMLMHFVIVLMLVIRIVLASTRSKKQSCTYTSQ